MHEVFEHTADLGLRVRADSLSQLFVDAAQGLFSMIVTNLDDVKPVDDLHFTITGNELEYLLFDWLNELLFTFESTHMLLSEFQCTVEDGAVRAIARGEALDQSKHQLDHEVKAITYHGLKIEQHDNEWLAEVIVDI